MSAVAPRATASRASASSSRVPMWCRCQVGSTAIVVTCPSRERHHQARVPDDVAPDLGDDVRARRAQRELAHEQRVRPRPRVHLLLDAQHRLAGAAGASARCARRAVRATCAARPPSGAPRFPRRSRRRSCAGTSASPRTARRTPRARTGRRRARRARTGSVQRARCRRARRGRARRRPTRNAATPSPQSSASSPRASSSPASSSGVPISYSDIALHAARHRPVDRVVHLVAARVDRRHDERTAVPQRIGEQVETRDRDDRDPQRQREHLGGRHADAQPGEHTRSDADRDRRQVVEASRRVCSHSDAIAGASTSACRGRVAGDRRRRARSVRAARVRTRARHRRAAWRCRCRGSARSGRTRLTVVADRERCERALERHRHGHASTRRSARPSRVRSSSAPLERFDLHDDAIGAGAPAATASPHSMIVTPSPSTSSSKPRSCSSWMRSSRYTSTCATGSRPAYCCTSVNVGLVTGPSTPSPRARPCAKVVLPAPRSPTSTTTSPGCRCSAIAAASARVVRGRRAELQRQHHGCGSCCGLIACSATRFDAHEVGAHLGQALPTAAQHRRRDAASGRAQRRHRRA